MTGDSQAAEIQAVEIQTGGNPDAAVIWLHGLGADGNDFVPIVPELGSLGAVRFVFPHAPQRPVTLNGGMRMRAWFDITGLEPGAPPDEAGIRASGAAIRSLIERENARGIASERIVLAGFSQGGAMALIAGLTHPQRLAGLIALSAFMPLAATVMGQRSDANEGLPVFLAHGEFDPLVHPSLGETVHNLLRSSGYAVQWRTYPMQHAVCPEEIADVAAFLRRRLAA